MLSALTFMGIPARAYATDISWWIGQIPILIVAPLVAFCYLPFFRKLNVTSAYEYLEHRFGIAVRIFASLSFILFHIGRIAIVLYLPALAISAVTGIDVTTAILIMSVLCIIYTVMGGIEAVVWTDAIQALVLMGGAILCFALVIYKVDGGFSEVLRVAQTDDKLFSNLDWGSFDIKDGTAAASVLFVAFLFNSLVPYTSGQDVVQRYVTTSDEKSARKSLWITMWMSVFGSLVFFGLGAAIYAFYKTQPELLNPAMQKTDGILPFYIVQQLPVGVSGLIIAAIFAASQSTISSSLNSSATAYIKDFDTRLFRPNRDDKTYLRAAQLAVVLIGFFGTLVAIIMAQSDIGGAFKMFNKLVGLTAGSLGGLFALGIFTKKANASSALIAAFAGSLTVVTLFLTSAPVTGLLYAFIGFMTCLIVGFLLGFVLPANAEQIKGLSMRTKSHD
jgi:SSS family transporter